MTDEELESTATATARRLVTEREMNWAQPIVLSALRAVRDSAPKPLPVSGETPRTDEKWRSLHGTDGVALHELLPFARQLERELNAAEAKLKERSEDTKRIDWLDRCHFSDDSFFRRSGKGLRHGIDRAMERKPE